jgi:ABC-2 type transport system ATP-binding protein
MRRRLDLAAALVHEPPVLFLDEPTTGLDPKGRNELWAVIRNLVAGGVTVLLTTQYLEEADALADRILVIDHGIIIAEGTANELKAQFATTVIEIGFRDQGQAARSAELLATVGDVRNEDSLVRVGVSGEASAQAMLESVRRLDGAGIEPATMVLREPTLDDVFLALTGHAAEEVQADDEDDGEVGTGGRGRRQAKGKAKEAAR